MFSLLSFAVAAASPTTVTSGEARFAAAFGFGVALWYVGIVIAGYRLSGLTRWLLIGLYATTAVCVAGSATIRSTLPQFAFLPPLPEVEVSPYASVALVLSGGLAVALAALTSGLRWLLGMALVLCLIPLPWFGQTSALHLPTQDVVCDDSRGIEICGHPVYRPHIGSLQTDRLAQGVARLQALGVRTSNLRVAQNGAGIPDDSRSQLIATLGQNQRIPEAHFLLQLTMDMLSERCPEAEVGDLFDVAEYVAGWQDERPLSIPNCELA